MSESLRTEVHLQFRMRGDIRRGTALCVADAYLFKAASCLSAPESRVVGLAHQAMLDGDVVDSFVVSGTCNDVLQNATPGEDIFLGPAGHPVRRDQVPEGAWLVLLGVAMSPTDLWVHVTYLHRKMS